MDTRFCVISSEMPQFYSTKNTKTLSDNHCILKQINLDSASLNKIEKAGFIKFFN